MRRLVAVAPVVLASLLASSTGHVSGFVAPARRTAMKVGRPSTAPRMAFDTLVTAEGSCDVALPPARGGASAGDGDATSLTRYMQLPTSQ